MGLIVFDLDHTLLTANSSLRFGYYLYRRRFLSFRTLLPCLIAYMRHKWGGVSIQALHSKVFGHAFRGRLLSDIHRHVEAFLTEELVSLLYMPVMLRLRQAQDRGDRVVILSSSPDFLVGEIARRLHVCEWKASVYQTNEKGEFNAISHIMEGQDKARHVRLLATERFLPSSEITVYSDSYLDLPVLKVAGKAIGVMPDTHLRRICLQNGWEIL